MFFIWGEGLGFLEMLQRSVSIGAPTPQEEENKTKRVRGSKKVDRITLLRKHQYSPEWKAATAGSCLDHYGTMSHFHRPSSMSMFLPMAAKWPVIYAFVSISLPFSVI